MILTASVPAETIRKQKTLLNELELGSTHQILALAI